MVNFCTRVNFLSTTLKGSWYSFAVTLTCVCPTHSLWSGLLKIWALRQLLSWWCWFLQISPAFLSWAISNLPVLQLSSPHQLFPHVCSVHLTLNFTLVLPTTSWTTTMIIDIFTSLHTKTNYLPPFRKLSPLPEFSAHNTSILDLPTSLPPAILPIQFPIVLEFCFF